MPQGQMPPPGEGPAVVIGIKPKGGPPVDGKDPQQPAGKGGKVSREEAHPLQAGQNCGNCEHYQGESGECEKVEGYWQPDEGCVKYFTPIGDSEPDADEQGGAPDNDADDMGANAGPRQS